MPELPEVETMARQLDARCVGQSLGAPVILQPGVIRPCSAMDLARFTRGRTIDAVGRRAKLVVFDLDSGDRLVIHPRMTGAPLLMAPGDETVPGHTCCWWPLSAGGRLVYRDIRRFGTVRVLSPAAWAVLDESLGLEPLAETTTRARFRAALGATKRPIKAVLLDPHRVVGIGNIYANEACHAAKLWPGTPTDTLGDTAFDALWTEVRRILRASIRLGGTSSRDYLGPDGRPGRFGSRLKVYGRHGDACTTCGDTIVRSTAWEQRSTWWCPSCQPAPRRGTRRRGEAT